MKRPVAITLAKVAGACFFCGRPAPFEPSVRVVACQTCRQQIADTQAERKEADAGR